MFSEARRAGASFSKSTHGKAFHVYGPSLGKQNNSHTSVRRCSGPSCEEQFPRHTSSGGLPPLNAATSNGHACWGHQLLSIHGLLSGGRAHIQHLSGSSDVMSRRVGHALFSDLKSPSCRGLPTCASSLILGPCGQTMVTVTVPPFFVLLE